MIKYFYALAISWNLGGTQQYGLLKGVTEVPPDQTQESVFDALLAAACTEFGAPPTAVGVIHYYLARNEL